MKRIDFLRYNPDLLINDTEGYKSRLGGYLTILVSALSVLSIVAFSQDLINKTNPFSSETEEINGSPFLANSDAFITLAPLLSGGVSLVDVDKYLDIQFGVIDMDGSRTTSATAYYSYFGANLCLAKNNTRFIENTNNLAGFFAVAETSYFCPPIEHNKIDLVSTYGSSKFIAWDIQVKLCKNTTIVSKCKSSEEIKSYLKLFFVHVIISTNLINTNNLTSPFIPTYTAKILRVSASSTRQEINFFKQMKLYSDEGFIMESLNNRESYYLSRFESDSIYEEDPANVLRLLITNDSNLMNIKREYIKVQKVAADVGGILKFFLIFISSFNYLFAKVDFYCYIHNRLFLPSSATVNNNNNVENSNYMINRVKLNNVSKLILGNQKGITSSYNYVNESGAKTKNSVIDSAKVAASNPFTAAEENLQISIERQIGKNCCGFMELIFQYYFPMSKSKTIKKVELIYSKLFSFEGITDTQVYNSILSEKSGMTNLELHNLCKKSIIERLNFPEEGI